MTYTKKFSLSRPRKHFLKSTRELLVDGKGTGNNIPVEIGDISSQIKSSFGYLIIFVLDGGLDEASTSVAYLDDSYQLKDMKNIIGTRKFLVPIYNFKSIESLGDEIFLISSWQENEGCKTISVSDGLIVFH